MIPWWATSFRGLGWYRAEPGFGARAPLSSPPKGGDNSFETKEVFMIYVLWAAVFFFAGSWTLGVLSSDRTMKSMVATVIYWWIVIGLALVSAFSPWHLIWVMPLSLAVCTIIMQMEISSSFSTSLFSILIKSLFIIAPVVGALIHFS